MTFINRVIESLKKSSADWVGKAILTLTAATFLMVYEPTRDAIVNRWTAITRIEQQINVQNERIGIIRADIESLRKPTKIFEVSRLLSGPVLGYCITGDQCALEVWARRVTTAKDCKIIPNLTEHRLINQTTRVSRRVTRVPPFTVRNLGLDWEPIQITLDIPSSIPVGDTLYVIVTFYSECPGTDLSSPPLSSESEPIEIEIRIG